MIILGRDSCHAVPIYVGGQRLADLSGVTRWVAEVGGVSVDLSDFPGDFALGQDNGGDLLLLHFGSQALQEGPQSLRLTMYDTEHPNGQECENLPLVSVRRASP
jgi:hypothetical protein